MEQTALRPRPMPGQEPGAGTGTGTPRRPHAARRRGRRLTTLLSGLFAGAVLLLSGIGLGTVGATVIGMSRLAEAHRETAGRPAPSAAAPGPASPAPARTAPGATLGVQAMDAEKAGALVVGVQVPGPGYTAGLVRGDVLLTFGGTRIDSAADLARAVARARPGTPVVVTVRHHGGGYQQLTATPAFVV